MIGQKEEYQKIYQDQLDMDRYLLQIGVNKAGLRIIQDLLYDDRAKEKLKNESVWFNTQFPRNY